MIHSAATWTFCVEDTELPERIEIFAGFGLDAISISPGQILRADDALRFDIVAQLDSHDLTVTVHGNCDNTPDDVGQLLSCLGDRLACFTVDGSRVQDSRGTWWDAERMAGLMREVDDVSSGTDMRFGIEDFPLDQWAYDGYRTHLAPLADLPRYGLLVDLGHMNIRRRRQHYFKGVSVLEYFDRLPVPLIEIHVHDNDGNRDQHGPIGFGNLPFDETASALRSIGFDGVSTIEIAPGFHGSTPAASTPKVEESLRHWRKLLA